MEAAKEVILRRRRRRCSIIRGRRRSCSIIRGRRRRCSIIMGRRRCSIKSGRRTRNNIERNSSPGGRPDAKADRSPLLPGIPSPDSMIRSTTADMFTWLEPTSN
jgi:hypothetical protein